jgi:predicted glycogen debranching enzyme
MREWLVTNGLGGYASLTYDLKNTRKYHGLLVASLNPPSQRWVFVTNIIDKLKICDEIICLSNLRPNFKFDFFPSFTYRYKGVVINKTILMEHKKNSTFIKYEIKTKKPVTITHNPIVNSRHIYDVNSQRYSKFKDVIRVSKDIIEVKPNNNDKSIKFVVKDHNFTPEHYWEELYYSKDYERGDSWIDNNINIGKICKTVDRDYDYYITLSIEEDIDSIQPSKVFLNEKNRKRLIVKNSGLDKKFEKLVLSADNFIVEKGSNKSVIAGYHWFGDWGRDTLIALPGLTLVTKRFDDAKSILQIFSKFLRNGLIPNAFIDRDSKPVYNNVDSSLWYIDRVYQYFKYSNDMDFIKNNWKVLYEIFDSYVSGTEFNIKMDEDYLISHGPGLTWMDVKIDDFYPTPRAGKAVEIQALWYNALRILGILSKLLDKQNIYFDLAENVRQSFNRKYDMLYDVLTPNDLSIRPNMIFLASLDFSMIDKGLQEIIVRKVKSELLTVFGIRTLSKDNPNYKGCYIGDFNKDVAYHNGTAWPWLIGSYVKAYVKIHDYKEKYRKCAFEEIIRPMLKILGDKWDGNINEIFDGNPVFAPRGCIAQAWSVAEILRCWVEDIENIKPDFEKKILSHEIRI